MEHHYPELLKEWKSGHFRAVYYFLGEDTAAQAEAAAQLKNFLKPDSFNFSEFSGDIAARMADILAEALTLPLLAERRLVMVRGTKPAGEAKAALVAYLKEPCPSTTLALLSDEAKADPKDSLVKAATAAGAVCVFRALKEGEAVARLQSAARAAGKSLAAEAAEMLVAEAGTDWQLLRSELEKALLFAGDSPDIKAEHVAACLGHHKSADPFALPRLIEARQLTAALAQLRRLFDDGKPDDQAFKALSQINYALQKQLRAKRMLQAGCAPEELFSALRLHAYWDRDFPVVVRRLSERRLKRDLEACLKTESALKSKTWLSAPEEIERLVVGLCSAEGRAGNRV